MVARTLFVWIVLRSPFARRLLVVFLLVWPLTVAGKALLRLDSRRPSVVFAPRIRLETSRIDQPVLRLGLVGLNVPINVLSYSPDEDKYAGRHSLRFIGASNPISVNSAEGIADSSTMLFLAVRATPPSQGYGVANSRLPRSRSLEFRPSTWKRYLPPLGWFLSFIGLEALLIVFLILTSRARWRAERAVRSRLALEQAISDLSARLTGMEGSDIGSEIERGLAKLLSGIDADRICWYVVPTGKAELVRAYSAATNRVAESPPVVRFEQMPYITAALMRGERIILRHLQDLPSDAVKDRSSIQGIGVKSLVLIPSRSCRGEVGVLGVSSFSNYREWTTGLISQLAVLGNVVGASLARAHTEQARRESERRFRCLFEQASLGIALETQAGKLLLVNPAFCSFLGYTAAELLISNCVNLTYPDDVNRERDLFAELQEGIRSSYDLEKRFVRKDRSVVWAHVSVSLLKTESGEPLIIGMAKDITEQKNAERQMEASWTLLHSTLDALPAQIAILDDSGVIIAVNAAWREMADSGGMKYSSYGVGKNFFEACASCSEDSRADRIVCERVRRLLRGDMASDKILQKRRTSALNDVWYQIGMERFEQAGSQRVVLAYRDVTELMKAREALARNQEHLSLALEASHAGTWDWSTSGGQLRWTSRESPDVAQYFSREDDHSKLMDCVYPDDRVRLTDAAKAAMACEGPFSCEFRVRAPSLSGGESVRWLFAKGRPQLDETGRIVRMLGVYVDITDLKQRDADLHDLAGRLIQAQEDERSRISRDLHDDVGQRISLMSVELDLLAGGLPKSSEVRLRFSSLLQQMNELAADVHHLSHELHSTKLQHLGLAAALSDLCRHISEQRGIVIDLNASVLPHTLPPSVAQCLFRISQEGLNNIVKHSTAKKAWVELAERQGIVRLRIRDSGIGFDPTQASRGIGLASMRERLRIVGGAFAIASRPGEGTEITAEVTVVRQAFAKEA